MKNKEEEADEEQEEQRQRENKAEAVSAANAKMIVKTVQGEWTNNDKHSGVHTT